VGLTAVQRHRSQGDPHRDIDHVNSRQTNHYVDMAQRTSVRAMASTNDLSAYRLRKRISDLEAENARYQKNQNLARKNEFRVTA